MNINKLKQIAEIRKRIKTIVDYQHNTHSNRYDKEKKQYERELEGLGK